MKNLIVYYMTILLPLLLLVQLALAGSSVEFTLLLFIYLFPYRTVVDGARLVNKQLMTWRKVWRLLIPGERIYYFKELYLRK